MGRVLAWLARRGVSLATLIGAAIYVPNTLFFQKSFRVSARARHDVFEPHERHDARVR